MNCRTSGISYYYVPRQRVVVPLCPKDPKIHLSSYEKECLMMNLIFILCFPQWFRVIRMLDWSLTVLLGWLGIRGPWLWASVVGFFSSVLFFCWLIVLHISHCSSVDTFFFLSSPILDFFFAMVCICFQSTVLLISSDLKVGIIFLKIDFIRSNVQNLPSVVKVWLRVCVLEYCVFSYIWWNCNIASS